MPTLMLEMTIPAPTGITAHAASASTQVTSGASRNTPLLAPAGMTGSLRMNLSKSAKDWNSPPRPPTCGPAPDLHRCPDLAVGQQHIGYGDEEDDEEHHALRH